MWWNTWHMMVKPMPSAEESKGQVAISDQEPWKTDMLKNEVNHRTKWAIQTQIASST